MSAPPAHLRPARLVLALLALAPAAATQCELAFVVAEGEAVGAEFGATTDIDGDIAVVGAPERVADNFPKGTVSVFRRDGANWILQQLLAYSVPWEDADYGASVAVSGNRIIVGAPTAQQNTMVGQAYIYEYDGEEWYSGGFLMASPTNQAGDMAGFAVDIDGDVAVMGVPGADGGAANIDRGLVLVSEYLASSDTWIHQPVLGGPGGTGGDAFGSAVVLVGDWIVVGAPGHDSLADNAGAIYVYRNVASIWTFQGKITASDGAAGDAFGSHLAFDGAHLVVGTPQHDETTSDDGVAYVFEFTGTGAGFVEVAKLASPTPVSGDLFGSSVSVEGARLLVGAPGDDDAGPDAGAVYEFELDAGVWSQVDLILPGAEAAGSFGSAVTSDGSWALLGSPVALGGKGSATFFDISGGGWTPTQVVDPGTGTIQDNYGERTALSGDTLAVAARYDDDHARNAGAVHVYRESNGVWTTEAKLVGSQISSSDQHEDEFGYSLDLQGDILVAGTPEHNWSDFYHRGGVWVFERTGTTWNEVAVLRESSALIDDSVGYGDAVALDGAGRGHGVGLRLPPRRRRVVVRGTAGPQRCQHGSLRIRRRHRGRPDRGERPRVRRGRRVEDGRRLRVPSYGYHLDPGGQARRRRPVHESLVRRVGRHQRGPGGGRDDAR